MVNITINETLCFIFSHYDSVANENISVVVSFFYTEEKLVKAKTVIHDVCVKSLGDGANVPRIIIHKGNNRRKIDADDILRYVALFDKNLNEAPLTFVARDLRRVPQINPGTVDLCFLSETVEDMRKKMEDLIGIKAQFVNLHNILGEL